MVKIDELFADLSFLEEAAVKPRANPPEPAPGKRHSYLITFDWGEGDTDGMLEALRAAGFFAWAKSRYPRTSIVCRTSLATKESTVLATVSGNLKDNGSAMVLRVGGDSIRIWPDKPWPGEEEKSWRRIQG